MLRTHRPESPSSRPAPAFAALVVATALLLVPSADAAKVGTRHERGADYSQLETFAWRPNERPESSPLAAGSELDTLIREIVTEELERRGFSPAAEGATADFEVDYDGYLETVVDNAGVRKQIAPGVAWVVEGDYRSKYWERGTLLLTLHRPGEQRYFWTAWATGDSKSPDQPDPKRIRRAVRKMLKRFPPG